MTKNRETHGRTVRVGRSACSCLGLLQKSFSHDRAGGVVGGGGKVYSALLWPKW